MNRILAIVLALGLAACAPASLPWTETPQDRFTAACGQFYDTVAVAATQRLLGNVSDETYGEANPYIELAHGICQDDTVTDHGDALLSLQEALEALEFAQKGVAP